MSAKPQKNLFIKLAAIVLIFLYLQLLLWFTLARPTIDIDVHWVPTSFFFPVKQSICSIRLHHTLTVLFESVFFSALALFGYFCGCAGFEAVGCGIYGINLASFEQPMMDIKYKYYWMCLLPWIITFTQNWLQNVGEFLLLLSNTTVYETFNAFSSITVMMLFLSLQALLACEVFFMALQGWHTMKNIEDENMLWEQKKRFLDGDSLNTT